MSDANDEVLAVLREIRDLQRQHFERYVEFTGRVIDQQKRSAVRADGDTAAALEEQRRIGRSIRQQQVVVPVLMVILAGCMAVAGWWLWLAFAR